VLPPAAGSATATPLTREAARDTLAPSSFGVIGGGSKPGAPAPTPMRAARAPLPTLGELEGATATATLRPPGAVPPPPRALPMPTPNLDATGLGSGSPLETPVPDKPVSSPVAAATVVSGAPTPPRAPADQSFDSTVDMAGTASKKATQAALIEQSRSSAVPAPGLYIADDPLEPRPKQASIVTQQRELLTRLRVVVLALGGALLMVLGALVVLIFRRAETQAPRTTGPTPSAAAVAPGCQIAQLPSRISPIERTVPIATATLADGSLAVAIADSKTSAAGWIFDPVAGEARRRLEAPAGSGDVTYVTPAEPLLVDRAESDFAFAHTLAPGLSLGVGPAGILRRGADGATGVVWPLTTGVRVTPPRVATLADRHFVAFRQGGAEGQMMTGWLRADGSAEAEPSTLAGVPKTLGTPSVALSTTEALVLFAARQDKSEPYRVHAARAPLGQLAHPAQALELPGEGGGAIAPSIAPFAGGRFLVQWTDGNVGQYQVHMRILDADLKPVSDALRVSAKGANAGQGAIVVAGSSAVSFFIQTTAGHDELWGATLSCH
jgi:hypothetical protein